MKNPIFTDPTGISKQEMFTILTKLLKPESLAWLDSITEETVFFLTNEEGFSFEFEEFKSFILKSCYLSPVDDDYPNLKDICKPMFLFYKGFFTGITDAAPVIPHRTHYFLEGRLKEIFRTDLFNEERIKSLPLLFTKIGNKETFYPWVGEILGAIKLFCTQNEEFAHAYQAKLAEIRSGSLRERLALYANYYKYRDDAIELSVESSYKSKIYYDYNSVICELEQPFFEMLKEYVNLEQFVFVKEEYANWEQFVFVEGNANLKQLLMEELYRGFSCDLSMSCNFAPMIDLLFVSLLLSEDRIQIPCWNGENFLCRLLLDYGIINRSIGIVDALFRNYTIFDTFQIICTHINWRKNNMPQFPGALDLRYDDSCERREVHFRESIKYLKSHIPEMFSFDMPNQYHKLLYVYFFRGSLPRKSKYECILLDEDIDCVKKCVPDFICKYLTDKLVSAINGNDHGRIRDINHLFKEGNKDWITWYGKNKEYKKEYTDFIQFMLILTSRGDKNCQPLPLEDFILKYIPLDMFEEVLSFPPFQEQNEDMYQNIIQKYPGLSRYDALLERLLPCFVTIAMRDINSKSVISKDYYFYSYPWEQLFLCILSKLCEMQETNSKWITLIFEMIIKSYGNKAALDIVGKYPQVQKPLLDYCYKTINSFYSTSVEFTLFPSPSSNVAPLIIGTYKGVWYGLKPLLILLRTVKIEWVDENLNGASLPDGMYNICHKIEYIYLDYFLESLKELRQEMANGLSDWLKPLPNSKRDDLNKRLENYPPEEKEVEGFDISYTEPNPIWRYAYVRAIADLGVDVDGKGHYIHSIMDKVAQKDPSEMVREAAAKTSAELKKLRDGWDGDNNYRKINLALWWFKWASRLAMNLPVDRIGALRSRGEIERNDREEYKRSEDLAFARDITRVEEIQAREKLMRARFGI
jgi:hypothetical protein